MCKPVMADDAERTIKPSHKQEHSRPRSAPVSQPTLAHPFSLPSVQTLPAQVFWHFFLFDFAGHLGRVGFWSISGVVEHAGQLKDVLPLRPPA